MYHNHHLHETKHLKEANLLQEEKYRHLTNDPVGKLVCEMAVPTIISMLVTAVYNLADTFFVGLMRSNAATGAVGVVFSLMAIIQATGDAGPLELMAQELATCFSPESSRAWQVRHGRPMLKSNEN